MFALFYDWAYTGHGFPMIGSGKNRYQLMDVEDLCGAIWSAMTLDAKIVNTEFNIGAKEFTTMRAARWEALSWILPSKSSDPPNVTRRPNPFT